MTKRALRPVAIPMLLFLGALFVRVLVLLWVARNTGMEWRNLALMLDGHFYILISKSFPSLYSGMNETFPLFANSAVFTGWFPVYPFLIYLADFLFRDPRVSALAVSMLAGGLSVVLFYELARRMKVRPVFAAIAFCFFTPTWLMSSTLALVESVYLCLFIATVLCFTAGRQKAAIALAGVVIITQKSGIVILPVFALALLWRHGPRGLTKFAPYLISLVPLILMQGYLHFLFGDPFVNLRVQHQTGYPDVIGIPFSAMVAGLGDAEQIPHGDFWLRKAMIALSCLFYTGVFALSWRGRAESDRILIVWLGVVLLFNLSLAGEWAYYAFPRFMTLAVPPAVLLLVKRLPVTLDSRRLAPLGLAVPVLFWIIARDIQSAVDLMMRVWRPQYFELLLRHIL